VSFGKANFSETNFGKISFRKVSFSEANFDKTNFGKTNRGRIDHARRHARAAGVRRRAPRRLTKPNRCNNRINASAAVTAPSAALPWLD